MGRLALELVRNDSLAPSQRPAGAASTLRLRIVDGALVCLTRQGLSKTTVDDIARAAGCSRATVYRVFPGGKDAVTTAVVDTEFARLFSELAVRMGEAHDLEAVLVAGMSGAAERISEHGALRFLLEHEPEVVLPHLAFDHHGEVLASVAAWASPFLGRWLAHDEAARVAEWAARIVLSYLSCPAPGIDLTDPSCTRRIVETYVLPGIRREPGTDEPGPELDADAPTPRPARPRSRRLVSVPGTASSTRERP